MHRTNQWARFSLMVIGFFLVLTLLAGCQTTANQAKGKLQVVAAEDFYGEVAQAVGGRYVHVTSVINRPNMDPHDYEPTTATARAVSAAQLVIYNGIGYDDWMTNLVATNQRKKTVIRVGEDLLGKKEGANEHLWYRPQTMPVLARALARHYAALDSKHAAYFKQNAASVIASLQAIQRKVDKLRGKADGKKVDVSEPVFDYMLRALGYTVTNNHFELAVEHETDPSPQDISAMQKAIRSHKIAFFVSNIQEISPTVKKMMTLANAYHVPVVKVTETLPKGKNYKTWMLDQLSQIEAIQNQ
ncbi:MAG: metal ABC transporter solute-binding protein [Sporolactobacillus sp.]